MTSLWTLQTSASDNDWQSVAYGNNIFVAVASSGTNNKVMTSPDGITWTSRSSALDTNSWQSVTFGNNLFVAVAVFAATGKRVMTSPDGINWTMVGNTPNYNWVSVAYGNNLWVAVAAGGSYRHMVSSSGGGGWTAGYTTATYSWQCVTYGNNLFVAVSSTNRVMTSPDGISWTQRTSASLPNNDWRSVTYGNGLFVAVAASGSNNRVMTSSNGINWTSQTSAADNYWESVTYGDGLFVAVASSGTNNRVMTSPDGITWTSKTSAYDNTWRSVAYGKNLFVAVAQTGQNTRVMTFEYPAPTISGISSLQKIYGNMPFTFTPPVSNSLGLFSYSSSDTLVATISENTITIISAGSLSITTTQSATDNYSSTTINTPFQVVQSTPDAPVIITNSDELHYFLGTLSTYAKISNDLDINYDLIASSSKVLTGNNIKITRTYATISNFTGTSLTLSSNLTPYVKTNYDVHFIQNTSLAASGATTTKVGTFTLTVTGGTKTIYYVICGGGGGGSGGHEGGGGSSSGEIKQGSMNLNAGTYNCSFSVSSPSYGAHVYVSGDLVGGGGSNGWGFAGNTSRLTINGTTITAEKGSMGAPAYRSNTSTGYVLGSGSGSTDTNIAYNGSTGSNGFNGGNTLNNGVGTLGSGGSGASNMSSGQNGGVNIVSGGNYSVGKLGGSPSSSSTFPVGLQFNTVQYFAEGGASSSVRSGTLTGTITQQPTSNYNLAGVSCSMNAGTYTQVAATNSRLGSGGSGGFKSKAGNGGGGFIFISY